MDPWTVTMPVTLYWLSKANLLRNYDEVTFGICPLRPCARLGEEKGRSRRRGPNPVSLYGPLTRFVPNLKMKI